MAREPIEVAEEDQLRAIAHPARWRVLTELYAGRTVTATEAAGLCGLTASAMSYHLNLLARHGLVAREESTDGRERPWRAVGDGLHIGGRPGPDVARTMMAGIADQIRRLILTEPREGSASTESGRWPASYTSGRLRLTDAQAKRLHEGVRRLIDEFEAEEEPSGAGEPPTYEFFWVQGIDHRSRPEALDE